MDFRDLVNRACGDLPPGWEIGIHLEWGAGWATLTDPEGEEEHIEVAGSLEDAILGAIEDAIRHDHLYRDAAT